MAKKNDLDIEKSAFSLNMLEYRMEQFGYWTIVLILIIALCGGFGPGLFKSSTLENQAQGLKLSYNKLIRKDDVAELNVQVTNVRDNQKASFWFSQNYLENFAIKSIIPQPLYSEVSEGKIIYNFSVQNPTTVFNVTFFLEPRNWGTTTAQIGIDNMTALQFKQFIYP